MSNYGYCGLQDRVHALTLRLLLRSHTSALPLECHGMQMNLTPSQVNCQMCTVFHMDFHNVGIFLCLF